jgi:uncharacterized protein DUF4399
MASRNRNSLLAMALPLVGAPAYITANAHLLLVDTELQPLDEPIPSDFNHLHFGAGQTEAGVTLPLDKLTLQPLLGDANHVPHNPAVISKPITVTMTRTGQYGQG